MGPLEKAKILVRDYNDKEIDEIEVLFNPEKYSVTKTAGWDYKGRTKTPHYSSTELGLFTVNLFFDTYEENADVREYYTNDIIALMKPTVEYKGNKVPPICIFTWGGFNFRGVIDKVIQNFTMFLSSGVPVRADLTVRFKPLVLPEERVRGNPPGDPTKTRTVKEGETLNLITFQEYGDPALWRIIAQENNIKNPRFLQAGMTLVIPALTE